MIKSVLRSVLLFPTLLIPTLLLCASGALAQSWEDPAAWQKVAEPTTTKDIVYSAPTDPGFSPKSQVLDVYRNAATPSNANSPVLVYIHGGGWNHGSKPASWHGFQAWLAAGFSVVSMEYRLVDAAPAPAAVQDARCVLSWVARNAAAYHFDSTRVVTYGTSSGGHLAMMAGFLPAANDIDLPQCKQQPRVVAVLDFYGPYHLEPTGRGAFTSSSTSRWMGPDPQPSLLAKEHAMSPSTYLRAGLPPVFLAHGDADPTVPYAASVALHEDLQRVGVKSVFDTVPGGGHGNWPLEQNQRVQLDSLRFLKDIGVVR